MRVTDELKAWFVPWLEVGRHPGPLVIWVLTAIAVGSTGYWLFPLLGTDSWRSIVGVSSLGSFGIVLLAEAHAASHLRTDIAESQTGRTIGKTVVILLLILQTAFLVDVRRVDTPLGDDRLAFQVCLTIAAILTATYLMCFRLYDLEPSVDEVRRREEGTVENLGEDAKGLSRTQDGEAL